jgi:signal transduction histidine kinase
MGTVVVRSEVRSGQVILSVENETTGTTNYRAGMGIGLVIARSIAEAHGGSLHETHPSPQRVTFQISLPLHGELP